MNFKSLKTVGEVLEVLEKSLNFAHACLYEPCFSLLIMMVQPQGPMFEVQIQGDVLSRRRKLDLMCDNTNMEFGGVALGQTR